MSTNNEMISFFNNEDNFNLLTDWEKRFVADLRKKSRITPRQRALLSKFYDRTNLVLSGQVQIDNETLVRVQNCLSQPIIERSSYEWLKNMMSSFVSQIKSGSKLTENQLKVVEDTERNSAEFNNWVANWDPEKEL